MCPFALLNIPENVSRELIENYSSQPRLSQENSRELREVVRLFIFFRLEISCGGGVEYLHRSPAKRRRRRKGKHQISDSEIWSRVLRDSDPRETELARASSNCKRQTGPLVRESAPQQQTRNCLIVIKICS
jgi:hypothetical protein